MGKNSVQQFFLGGIFFLKHRNVLEVFHKWGSWLQWKGGHFVCESLKLGKAVARLKTPETANLFFASKKPLSEDSHHPMVSLS